MILVPVVAFLAAVLVWWVSRDPERVAVVAQAREHR
jgi:uncharacterized Tic20 family protein